MKTIKLTITSIGRNSLKDNAVIFDETNNKYFNNMDDAKKYLTEHYGKMPGTRNKIYIDDDIVIGFLHSFWNRDISHNSKPWFQTDWITFSEVKPIENLKF